MCKELAPVMIAILIAGRIGSAMSAEIGSMRVYEEIDALRTMNIDPVSYLVLPRMVAIALALPVLVLFAIPVGWLGGALVCASTSKIAVGFDSFLPEPAPGGGSGRRPQRRCSNRLSSPWPSASFPATRA